MSHADIMAGSNAEADSKQYLTFYLNGEEYGVEILRVQGIQGWDTVTPIPHSPEYILGVMNLRGAIVPIIDLRKRFNMPDMDIGKTTVIIVVNTHNDGESRTIGMVTDAVSEVYSIDENALQPLPDFGGSVSSEFVKGLSTIEDKMLILLDIDRLLDIRDKLAPNSQSSAA